MNFAMSKASCASMYTFFGETMRMTIRILMTVDPDSTDQILILDPDPAGSGDAPLRLDARHSQADLQGLSLQTLLLLEAGT